VAVVTCAAIGKANAAAKKKTTERPRIDTSIGDPEYHPEFALRR
jgi:hypothetical protein